MSAHAPRRILSALLALTAAALACARAEVPIDPAGHSIATAIVLPATPTVPDAAVASPTSLLAEATQLGGNATSTATATPPPTATPESAFDQLPLLNGTFDTDLSNWNVTPNFALWQDGFARLNAGQAGAGAVMVQFTTVPRGREVKLHFTARSETAQGGECLVETARDAATAIPADGEWHEAEVDYTLDAGTQTAVSLQARNNNHCDWLHLDDVYWLVAADAINSGGEATATPDGPTPAGTPAEAATATEAPPTPLPTVGAIPAAASFMQDFTASAAGDTIFGAAADVRDGQALTWASLRAGTGAWLFDLGSERSVAGLRLTAHRDGDQDTTLLGIDVSTDGAAWTTVYSASGDCAGTANCQSLAQGSPVDLAFGPTAARYLRVRSGPTRFALAEVQIAVIGN